MSENKQTLFRFRTMRAPKEFDPSSMHLIHPYAAVEDGVFFTAVAERDPEVSIAEAMNEAAESFVPLGADAPGAYTQYYNFGDFIITNRNTVTYAELEAAFTAVTVPLLTDEEATELWDNLFYQTITLGLPSHRESLIKILIGNGIAMVFSALPETDEMARFISKSRLVLPTALFNIEEEYTSATNGITASYNNELLTKHMSIAESQLKAQLGTSALSDLAQYKAKFYKTNLPEETSANTTFLKSVETAIKAATPEIERDPFTGELKKVINPTIPTPTYVPNDEVDLDEMETEVSPETLFLINELGLDTSKTFAQLEKSLNEYILEHQNDAFSKSDFAVEKLFVNGTLMRKCDARLTANPDHGFMMKAIPVDDKYKIVFVMNVGASCSKLETASLSLDPSIGLGQPVHTLKDGILTVDFTPDGAIEIEPGTEFQIALMFSNGVRFLNPNPYTLYTTHAITNFLTLMANGTTEAAPFIPSGFGINRLGIGEYRRVEQTLCCYVPGEVSHIENVMAREYKERSTRRLRRSEETTTQTSSQEREHMTDTSSTSRFDMQQEISEVISKSQENSRDISFNASVNGSFSLFGNAAGFDVGSDFSTNSSSSTSQENSNSQSVSMAKEIIEKVQDRVLSKISEERVRKIVDEFEEQNRHGFDNRKGTEHISGVYRWVDKVYKNQVFNYGKRLQYEFMIPEPASFHLATKVAMSEGDMAVTLLEPRDPRKTGFGVFGPLAHAGLVTESNYQQWAATFGAAVTPPPAEIKTVSKTLIKPQDGSDWSVTKVVNEDIAIPEGYGIRRIWCSAQGNGAVSNYDSFQVSVGGINAYLWADNHPRFLLGDHNTYPNLERYVTSVPATVQFTHIEGGMVSAELELVRKPETLAEWQLDTFNAIIEAYEDRLAQYESKIAEIEARTLEISADNPKYLRRIENTVLKKNCIAYLIGHLNMGKGFIQGTATTTTHVKINATMDKYAATVKFFEQAFEWELMDYMFYPFYWADRTRWQQLYNLDNDDALFRSFLQAGMARTVLTVRPGFEEAVMFYMNTGLIWNGGDMPVLNDPLYLSIKNELATPEYFIDETWETRVPSTLTVIQAKSIALNAEGLPCYCDEEAEEETIVNQPTALLDLDVFIEGDTEEP